MGIPPSIGALCSLAFPCRGSLADHCSPVPILTLGRAGMEALNWKGEGEFGCQKDSLKQNTAPSESSLLLRIKRKKSHPQRHNPPWRAEVTGLVGNKVQLASGQRVEKGGERMSHPRGGRIKATHSREEPQSFLALVKFCAYLLLLLLLLPP